MRYLPASDGVHVGGDWYDAFPLDRHRVGLAIGNVAGHSIDSAGPPPPPGSTQPPPPSSPPPIAGFRPAPPW